MQPTAKRIVQIVPPGASVSGGSFTAGVVDTAGYTHVEVFALLGAVGATFAALKIQETDALSGGTPVAPTDVPGCVAGTDPHDGVAANGASALPGTAQANGQVKWEIDMRGRKRYLVLVATAGAGATYLAAFASLNRGDQLPTTAAQKNATLLLKCWPGGA